MLLEDIKYVQCTNVEEKRFWSDVPLSVRRFSRLGNESDENYSKVLWEVAIRQLSTENCF